MRLLLIASASVILFFPLYWLLHPFFGPNWAAGIAALMMYIGFPSFFLLKWSQRSTHPVIKACNYLFAVMGLGLVSWISYRLIYQDVPITNAIGLITTYGYLSIYFLKNGYMPYQAEEIETSEDEPWNDS